MPLSRALFGFVASNVIVIVLFVGFSALGDPPRPTEVSFEPRGSMDG
jgi:hypothetical protein